MFQMSGLIKPSLGK